MTQNKIPEMVIEGDEERSDPKSETIEDWES
jgi:hypothetical protein